MRVAFVGPSLPNAADLVPVTTTIRPPAGLGDVARAVDEGASAICLIDGYFEDRAPVRHKEILFALSQDVAVLGAASMGALRAAECAPFGMRGLGRIYQSYIDGTTDDDADVALLHAPVEFGYAPITIPFVNIRATLQALVSSSECTQSEAVQVGERLRSVFYKQRTWKRLEREVGSDFAGSIRRFYVDQKRLDALEALAALGRDIGAPVPTWSFNCTDQFKASLD
ncbi:antibiotic resistance protein [Rhizobiales bacterium RZME27]|uniref:Antibiotic resistance protein n=1 Tax=Endobacterium cereale TaxID=2663029 RepID=A0A6A8A9F5_9HYPH|nr:antibiotic resistance protein [Endobacterium cereale]